MTREQEIEMMVTAGERQRAVVARALSVPEIRAVAHQRMAPREGEMSIRGKVEAQNWTEAEAEAV